MQAGPPRAGWQDGVQVSYEDFQGRRLHNLSGHPVPVIWHLHVKKMLPDIQRELLVFFHFVPIVLGPVAKHSWEEPRSVPFSPFLQKSIHIGKMPPEPPFLQAEQFQLSHPFLIGEMLQSLHHLWCCPLDFPVDLCLSYTVLYSFILCCSSSVSLSVDSYILKHKWKHSKLRNWVSFYSWVIPFYHGLRSLIYPLRSFPPTAEIHMGTVLLIPTVIMNNLEVFKGLLPRFESTELL